MKFKQNKFVNILIIVIVILFVISGIITILYKVKINNQQNQVLPLKFQNNNDLNGQDQNVLLREAIQLDDLNMVQDLIKSGVDIDVKNSKGEDALMISVIYNNFNITKALIQAGADVNTKDNNNKTALMVATEADQLDMIQLLKNSGAFPYEIGSACDSEFQKLIILINAKSFTTSEIISENIPQHCITIGPVYNDLIAKFINNNNLIDTYFEVKIPKYFNSGINYNVKKNIILTSKLDDNIIVDGFTSDGKGEMVIVPRIKGKEQLKEYIKEWIFTFKKEYQIGYLNQKTGEFIITHIIFFIQ